MDQYGESLTLNHLQLKEAIFMLKPTHCSLTENDYRP